MSWNIGNDGRVTRLDDGPKYPWWWNLDDEPGKPHDDPTRQAPAAPSSEPR